MGGGGGVGRENRLLVWAKVNRLKSGLMRWFGGIHSVPVHVFIKYGNIHIQL